MYKAINATFEVKITPINPQAKPLYFYDDVQINANDEYQLEDMANDFAKDVVNEQLEDAICDSMEDYSISQETYDKLPSKEKVKYAEFGLTEKRYILAPKIDIDKEFESYPQTLSEHYADIGMSERDF